MRILSAGIQHETNTFAVTPTTLADFQRDSDCGPEFDGGDHVVELYRDTGTIHGGYLDAADAGGFELQPLLVAHAQPAGRVTNETFNWLLNATLDRTKAALPCDGVLLDLHGAMVTDAHEDAEGVILDAVRELVGPDVPIVATFDYHGNITRRMVDAANVLIGFDTYPHVDMRERGFEAGELLARIVRGEVNPVQAYRQLPLLTMPPMQCTLREPMQSFMAGVHKLELRPCMLTATVAMGFPFADIYDAGVTVLATADGDTELAEQAADELAIGLWNLRDELQPKLTTIEETIRFCNEHNDGLVILADGSDNPGGGAPCDGTVALAALLKTDFQGAVVGVLYDPETVQQASAAGVGSTIRARIGGKTDDRHGETIETDAHVRTLSDGRFIYGGPMRRGLDGDFGPMVVLSIGGVEVVLASRRQQLLDAEMLRIVGITPEKRRLLVAKSAVHFRADFGPLAAHIFDADTPGIHRPDFANYTYERVRRPVYPLDTVK